MPIGDQEIASAATRNDVAVLVIGRAAGEDREMVLEAGSYYLTVEEERLLDAVTTAFDRTIVVLDAGNVIDLGWSESRDIDAVLLAWCGGMEGGRALADVLTGAAEPGGRLTAQHRGALAVMGDDDLGTAYVVVEALGSGHPHASSGWWLVSQARSMSSLNTSVSTSSRRLR